MSTVYPDDILNKIRERLEPLAILKVINYRLDTLQEIGETVKSFCPIHKEMVFRTLLVDKRTRRYRCSYSLCKGNKGGDLIDLYARAFELEYDEGVRRLVDHFKIPIELPAAKPVTAAVPAAPPKPVAAPPKPAAAPQAVPLREPVEAPPLPPQEGLKKTLEVSANLAVLGAHDAALEGFNQILALEPENIEALEGLAALHLSRNDENKWAEVLGNLTSITWKHGKIGETATYCLKILEKRPDDTESRLRYIDCLVAQKESHRALEEYMRLADYFEARQEFDRALEMYRKIEHLNLDIIDVYPHIIQLLVASDRAHDAVEQTLQKAAEHERQGDHDRARECYRYVLEIDDSRTDVREKIIDATVAAGPNEGSIEQCLALVDAYIHEEAYASAARALEKLGQESPGHIGVMAKYIEVLRLQSRDSAATDALLEMVGLLANQGRLEEAATHLRSFVSTPDLSIESLKRVAAAQRQCGLVNQAAATYSVIVDRLTNEGRFAEAAETCDQAIELNAKATPFRERQVECYLRSGHLDRAREKSVALAEFAIAERRWEDAYTIVTRALEVVPDDLQLIESKAQILTALGRGAEAQECHMALARRYSDSQQWDVAKRTLQRVLAVDPTHLDAALLLADVGINQGDVRTARDYLQRIAPELLREKDYARAKTALGRLNELAPEDPLVLVQLASVYENLGEDSRLLDTYRKLVTAYMANEAYPKVLEYCTAILGRDPENIWVLEQMIKVYEKTDKIGPITDLCLRLAQIHENLDDVDRVQEYYERAIKNDPTNIHARIAYIQSLAKLHHFEAASKQAQPVIAQMMEQQRYPEAIQVAEDLLQHSPDDITLRRSLIELCRLAGQERAFVTQCTQLINLHYRRNEFAEVVNLYRELLQREPDNVTFRTQMIDALMRSKRRDEAIEQLLELADRYIKSESFEDAENTLLEVLNHSPSHPRALAMLMEALFEAGRGEQAVQRAHELCEIYAAEGKKDKVVEVLRRCLALDPNNSQVLQWMTEAGGGDQQLVGSVGELQKPVTPSEDEDFDSIVQAQREAVEREPHDTGLRRKLAEMLDKQDNTPASLDELIQVARVRVERGQFDKASQALDEILDRDPENYAARRLRAEIFAKMGDKQRALEEFMKLTPGGSTPAPEDLTALAHLAEGEGLPAEPLQIVPDFTFDNFVVGENSTFAHAMALAVAKAPAMHYNPLFVYSDVGLGKTHLISAIANYIAQHQPDLRVIYTSAEEFTVQLVQAIQNNTSIALRNQYKAAGVLLMDDIQFLAGKERAQEEFFHIFNALFQAKRQIVVTSDRPPKDIARLEKRLKSRFGSGVIVDIQLPDLETRAAILKKDLERHASVPMDNRLIHLIAERITTNVRELKGALNQILVKHELTGEELNEAFVLKVLEIYGEKS